jgi:hypothetical protein
MGRDTFPKAKHGRYDGYRDPSPQGKAWNGKTDEKTTPRLSYTYLSAYGLDAPKRVFSS